MSIEMLFAKLSTVAILSAIVLFVSGCSNLPVQVPIDLSEEGSVIEFEAKITKADSYAFMLLFYTPQWKSNPIYKKEYNTLYDALSFFVGGGDNKEGQIIPIHLMIYKINKKNRELISDKIYDTKGDDGLAFRDTGDFIFRWFTSYNFEKGKYLIRVENLKGFEFMKNKRSEISLLRYRRKY